MEQACSPGPVRSTTSDTQIAQATVSRVRMCAFHPGDDIQHPDNTDVIW